MIRIVTICILALFVGGATVSGTVGGAKINSSQPGTASCAIPAAIPCELG